MRPVDMEIHDLIAGEMSFVPQPEESFKRSCRSLLDCNTDISIPRIYVYSTITLQSVTLRYLLNDNNGMLLLADDEFSVHTPEASGYTSTPMTDILTTSPASVK